ncbi:MAG: response regulator, partial [Myxococcales bacterium]|nr:response regulator [Myxococcales bacterium]
MQGSVIVVEDEVLIALELEERLRGWGYEVLGVAHSAQDGLNLARSEAADLALLDVRLGGDFDGIELAAELRSWGIPSVFLTAHGDDETLARIKAVGAQGYLLKPFEPRLLRLTLETALHRHRSERAQRAAEDGHRRAEAMQASILAHSPDAVLVLEGDGTLTLANAAARSMLAGQGEHEGARLRLEEVLPGLTVEGLRERVGGRVECYARRGDDEGFPVELSVGRLPVEVEGQLLLFVRDQSVQRRLEHELATARQLELTGRLAAGVAHDLNNLLSAVGVSCFLLGRDKNTAREELEVLSTAVDLGTALTTKLLVLAGRAGGPAAPIVVNQALRKLEGLLRRVVGETIVLELQLDSRAGAVTMSEAHFDQL